MTTDDRQRVVAAWLAIQRNWWAYEKLESLCSKDPDEAWKTIVSLVNLAETDCLLGDIGAGPLEDLLRTFGPVLIEQVEIEMANNARLHISLSHVHLSEHDSEVARRLLVLGCK